MDQNKQYFRQSNKLLSDRTVTISFQLTTDLVARITVSSPIPSQLPNLQPIPSSQHHNQNYKYPQILTICNGIFPEHQILHQNILYYLIFYYTSKTIIIMQSNITESKEARLYTIQGNTTVYIEKNDLIIQKNTDGTHLLIMGRIILTLTPQTLIWFDSPDEDQDHCLVYYFRNPENQDYMIKIPNNAEAVHLAVRESGCQRKNRKIYYRQRNNQFQGGGGMFGSLGAMLNEGIANLGNGVQNFVQGGMQRFGNPNNVNLNANYRNQSPTNQHRVHNDPPYNMPQSNPFENRQRQNQGYQNNQNPLFVNNQNNNVQNNPLNYAREMVGNFFSGANLNNLVVPNEGDHPIIRAGKNMLGGALNMYNNGVNGVGMMNQNQPQNMAQRL